jgi:ribonucleoside-triphosphate reductase
VKGIQFDNAAQRKTYVGWVYEVGTRAVQEHVLATIPEEFSRLHREGRIHIHDLEAYGQTYNCLQMDVLRGFPYGKLQGRPTFGRISGILDHFRDLVVKLGNEQSGGIGFPNFDADIETLFARLNIVDSRENLDILGDSLEAFIEWANQARDRCGQTTYYVSLNLGLATDTVGRFVSRKVLEYFRDSSLGIIKPNIVFKVKRGVNHLPGDPNHDLFRLALDSTCRKMIPTYLLFDSAPNAGLDPFKVAIMGCRTKVVADVVGEDRSVGRGNIDYVTINLPRIALEIDRTHHRATVDEKVRRFETEWASLAVSVKAILLDRYRRLLDLTADDFPCNQAFRLWLADFASPGHGLETVFRHGTLSIGFIGLSEAMEVLTGEKFYASAEGRGIALDIVRFMRRVVDGFRQDLGLNFTLLATSGEYISGRFPAIDSESFDHPVLGKGFYTNSFHVDVDSRLNPFEKLAVEGPFHAYANGGCISYVEFSSAPLDNTEAVAELVQGGVLHGVNYLGINFPLDRCLDCEERGTFDRCTRCGSERIERIRRVSGYLEDLDYFTPGKKAEVARRLPNAFVGTQGGQ